MTLAAVWIEDRGPNEPALCFASDSRTKPGPIEGVVKVTLFGRPDIAGVWAGDYRYAYLAASHLDAIFTASEVMRNRDVGVSKALNRAGNTLKDHLAASVAANVPSGEVNVDSRIPDGRTTLIVGGYSLSQQEFMLLRVQWQVGAKRWVTSVKPINRDEVVFLGDSLPYARRLAQRMRERRAPPADQNWHMEPLGTIYYACLDERQPTIGGRLQLAKVLMHGRSLAYGFVDATDRDTAWVRGTLVDERATRELQVSARLIDLSTWNQKWGSFGARRAFGDL